MTYNKHIMNSAETRPAYTVILIGVLFTLLTGCAIQPAYVTDGQAIKKGHGIMVTQFSSSSEGFRVGFISQGSTFSDVHTFHKNANDFLNIVQLPVGDYMFSGVDWGGLSGVYAPNPTVGFSIKEGAINYVGDFNFEFAGNVMTYTVVDNRTSVRDRLTKSYNQLMAKYPFEVVKIVKCKGGNVLNITCPKTK